MDYLLSIFAGVIQGLTEFLPVSSSGHLVLFHEIFNFNFPDNVLFDVSLHLGTFVALFIFFYRDIEKMIRGFFSSLSNWNLKNNYNQRLAWLVIIGTIPAVIVGYLFDDFIEQNFRSPLTVGIMLIVVGILFWISEKKSIRQNNLQSMKRSDALLVGIAQILALIPGTSRSGITIIAGMGRKLKRDEAARFSFLLSMPIIFGAGIKKIIDIDSFGDVNFLLLFVGGISSAITGYFVVKYLIKYLSGHSLNIFAWYRLTIGCLILIWFFFFTTGV